MDFFLKFLFLSGKYLTQITAQSIIEAYRRSMRLRQSLSSKLEKQFHPVTPYENILELYNENLDEITRNAQMQMAFISDEHKKEFERYLKEIEEEGSLKQLQRVGDERMLRKNNNVVEEQFNKIEEDIKRDSLRRSQTPIFNVPRKPSSFKIPKGEDAKAKVLHREWIARKSNKLTDDFEKLQEDEDFTILKKALKEDDELLKSPSTSKKTDDVLLKSAKTSENDEELFEFDETLTDDDDFLKLRQAQKDELLKLRKAQNDELRKLRKAWKDNEAFSKSLKNLEEDEMLQMRRDMKDAETLRFHKKDEQSKASGDDEGVLQLNDDKLFKIRNALKGNDHLTELRKALNEDELFKLRKALIEDDGLLSQEKTIKRDKQLKEHEKWSAQKKTSMRDDELLKLGKKLYEDEQFGSKIFDRSRFTNSTDTFRNRRFDREREFRNEISLKDYEKMCKALRGDLNSGSKKIKQNPQKSDAVKKEKIINPNALKYNSLRMKNIVDSKEFVKTDSSDFKEITKESSMDGELLTARTSFVKSKKLSSKDSTDKNKTSSSEKLSLREVESRLLKYKDTINKSVQENEPIKEANKSKTQKVGLNLSKLRDKIIKSKGPKKVEENPITRKDIIATERDKSLYLKSLHEKIKLDRLEDQFKETKTSQGKTTIQDEFTKENEPAKSKHTIIESNLPPKPEGEDSSNFTIILSMQPGYPKPEKELMKEASIQPLKADLPVKDPVKYLKRTTQENLLKMKEMPLQPSKEVDRHETHKNKMMGVLVFTPSEDNKYTGLSKTSDFFDECQTNDVPCKIFEPSLKPNSFGTIILTSKPNFKAVDFQDAAYIEAKTKEMADIKKSTILTSKPSFKSLDYDHITHIEAIAKEVVGTVNIKKTGEDSLKSKPLTTIILTPNSNFDSSNKKNAAYMKAMAEDFAETVNIKQTDEENMFERGPKSKPFDTIILTPTPSFTGVDCKDAAYIEALAKEIAERVNFNKTVRDNIFKPSTKSKPFAAIILTPKPSFAAVDYKDSAYIEAISKEIADAVNLKKTVKEKVLEPNIKLTKPFGAIILTPKPSFTSLDYKDAAYIKALAEDIAETVKFKKTGEKIFESSLKSKQFGAVVLTPKPNFAELVSKVNFKESGKYAIPLDQLNISISDKKVSRRNAIEADGNNGDEVIDSLGNSKPVLVLTPNGEGPWDIHKWFGRSGAERSSSFPHQDLIQAIENAKEGRPKTSLYRREMKLSRKDKTHRNAWPRLPLKDETMKDEMYTQPENPFLRKRWNRLEYLENCNKPRKIEYIETTELEQPANQFDKVPQRVDKIKVLGESIDDVDQDTYEKSTAEAKKRVTRTLEEAERNASWLMKNIEEFLKFENRVRDKDFDKKLLTLDNECRDILNTDQVFADFEEHLWKQTMEDAKMDGLRLNKSVEVFEQFENALNSELRDDKSKFIEVKTRETVSLNKSLDAFEEFDRTLDSMRKVDENLPQNLKEILRQKRADKTQNESIEKSKSKDVFDKLIKMQNISLEENLSEDPHFDGLTKTQNNISLEENQPKDQTLKESKGLEKMKENNLNMNRIIKSGNKIQKVGISDTKIPSLIKKDLKQDKNSLVSKGFPKKTISLEGMKIDKNIEDDENAVFGFAKTSLRFNKTIVEKNLVNQDKHNLLKENKSIFEARKTPSKKILLSATQKTKTTVDLKTDQNVKVSKTKSETLKMPLLKKASTQKKETKQKDISQALKEKMPLKDQLLKSSKGDTSKGKTNKVFEDLEKAGKALEARKKEIKHSLKREQSLMENSKTLDNLEVFLNPKLVEDVKVKKNTETFEELMKETNKEDAVLAEKKKHTFTQHFLEDISNEKSIKNPSKKVSRIEDENTRKISNSKISKNSKTEHLLNDSAIDLAKSLTELDLMLNFKSLQEKVKCFDDFLPNTKHICENPELLNMQVDEFGEDVKQILQLIDAKMLEMDALDYSDLNKVKNYITWKQENLSQYRELHEIIKEPGILKEIEEFAKLLEVNDAQCKRVMRNLTHKLLDTNIKKPKMNTHDMFPLFLEWGVKVDEELLKKEAAVIEANRKAFEEMEEQFKVVKIISASSFNKGDDPNRLPIFGDQINNLGLPKSPRGSNDKGASRKYTTQMQMLPSCILQKEETALICFDDEADGMIALDYDKILEHLKEGEIRSGLHSAVGTVKKETANLKKSSEKDEAFENFNEEEMKMNKEEKALVLLSPSSQKEEINKMDKDNLGRIICVASSTTAQRANIFKAFQEHYQSSMNDEFIENSKPKKSISDKSLKEKQGFIARLAKGKIKSLHELAIKSSVAELAIPQRKLEATTISTERIKSQAVRNYSQKSIKVKKDNKLEEFCEEISKDYSKLLNEAVSDSVKAINTGDKLQKFLNESIGKELNALKKEVFDGIGKDNEVTWSFEDFEFPTKIHDDFDQNVTSGNIHDSPREDETKETGMIIAKPIIESTGDSSSITKIEEIKTEIQQPVNTKIEEIRTEIQPVNSQCIKAPEEQILSEIQQPVNEKIEEIRTEIQQPGNSQCIKPLEEHILSKSSHKVDEGIEHKDHQLNSMQQIEPDFDGAKTENSSISLLTDRISIDFDINTTGDLFSESPPWKEIKNSKREEVGNGEHLESKDAKVMVEENVYNFKEYTEGNSSMQKLASQEVPHKLQPIGVKKSVASKNELLAVEESLQKLDAFKNDEKIVGRGQKLLKNNVSNRDLPQAKSSKQKINSSKDKKESKHDLHASKDLCEKESKQKLSSTTNDSAEGKAERSLRPISSSTGIKASKHKFDTKATLLRKESKLTNKIEDSKYDVSKQSISKSIPVHGKQSNQKLDASKTPKVSPSYTISKESKLKLNTFGATAKQMVPKKVESKQSIKSSRGAFNEHQSKQKFKENEKLGSSGYEKILPRSNSEVKNFDKTSKALPKTSSEMKTVDTSRKLINFNSREFKNSKTESLPDLIKLRISTDAKHEGEATGREGFDSVSQNSSKTETILLHMKDLTSSNSSKCFGDYVNIERNDQAKNDQKHDANEKGKEKQLGMKQESDANQKSLIKTDNKEKGNTKLESTEAQESSLKAAVEGNRNNSSLMLIEKKTEPLEYVPLHPDVMVKSLVERNIWSMMGLAVNPLKENSTSFEEFHKSQIAFEEVNANIIEASALKVENLNKISKAIDKDKNDPSKVEKVGSLFEVIGKESENASSVVAESLVKVKDGNSEKPDVLSTSDETKILKQDNSMQDLTKVVPANELKSSENDLFKPDLKQPASNARFRNDTSKENANLIKAQKDASKVDLTKQNSATTGKSDKSQMDGKIRSTELLKKQTVTDFNVVFEKDTVTKNNLQSVDKRRMPEMKELEIKNKSAFTNLQGMNVKVKDVTKEDRKKFVASKKSNENVSNSKNAKTGKSAPKKVVEKESKIVASKKSNEDVLNNNDNVNVVKSNPKKLAAKLKKIVPSQNLNKEISSTSILKIIKTDPVRDMKKLVEDLQADLDRKIRYEKSKKSKDLDKKIQCESPEKSEENANILTYRNASISKSTEMLNIAALQFDNSNELAHKTNKLNNDNLRGTDGVKGIELEENQVEPKERKNEIEKFLAKGEIRNLKEVGNNPGRNNEMSMKQVKEKIRRVLAKSKLSEIERTSEDKEIDFVEVKEFDFKDALDLKAETTLGNTEENAKKMESNLTQEDKTVSKRVSMIKSKDANSMEANVITGVNKNSERTSNLPLKHEDKVSAHFEQEKSNEEKANLMPQKPDEGNLSNKKANLVMPEATINDCIYTKVFASGKKDDQLTMNPFSLLKDVTHLEQEKNIFFPKKQHDNNAGLGVQSAKNSNAQAKPQNQQISKNNEDQNTIKTKTKTTIEEQISKHSEDRNQVKSKSETKIEEKRNDSKDVSLMQKNRLKDKSQSKVEEEYNQAEIEEKIQRILNKKKDRVDANQKGNDVKVEKDQLQIKPAELEENLNSDGKVLINKTILKENTDKHILKEFGNKDLIHENTSNSKKDINVSNKNIGHKNTSNAKKDINLSKKNNLKEEHHKISKNVENQDGKLESNKNSLEEHRDFIEKVKTNLKMLELETRSKETRLELETRPKETRLELGTRSKETRLESETQPAENPKINNLKRSELESQQKENFGNNSLKPLELESQSAEKSKNNVKCLEADKTQPTENSRIKDLKRVEVETQSKENSKINSLKNLKLETEHKEENNTKMSNSERLELTENHKINNVKRLESGTQFKENPRTKILKLLETGKSQSAEARIENLKRSELEPRENFGVGNLKPLEFETEPNEKLKLNNLKRSESETEQIQRLKFETQPTKNPKIKKISFKNTVQIVSEENQDKEEFISVSASDLDHPEIITYNPPPKIVEEEKGKIAEESSKVQENLAVVRKIGMIQNLQRANDFSPITIFKNSIWNCEVGRKVSDKQLFMTGSKFLKGRDGKDKSGVKAVKNYKYERKEVMSALGKPITVTYLVEDVAEKRK